MTRQLRRYRERGARKALTRQLGKPADPDVTAAHYQAKLSRLPLTRIAREYKNVYHEANQVERVLYSFRMANEGKLPLLSAPEAPVALALGNKFYYIAAEMARRGVMPEADAPLGGPVFREFFVEVSKAAERGDKEIVGTSFLDKFAHAAWKLLRGKR